MPTKRAPNSRPHAPILSSPNRFCYTKTVNLGDPEKTGTTSTTLTTAMTTCNYPHVPSPTAETVQTGVSNRSTRSSPDNPLRCKIHPSLRGYRTELATAGHRPQPQIASITAADRLRFPLRANGKPKDGTPGHSTESRARTHSTNSNHVTT